jgi:hypothetical protein
MKFHELVDNNKTKPQYFEEKCNEYLEGGNKIFYKIQVTIISQNIITYQTLRTSLTTHVSYHVQYVS